MRKFGAKLCALLWAIDCTKLCTVLVHGEESIKRERDHMHFEYTRFIKMRYMRYLHAIHTRDRGQLITVIVRGVDGRACQTYQSTAII